MPVIMFARQFPAYHPRAGEPTYFVEKLITSFIALGLPGYGAESIQRLRGLGYLDVGRMIIHPSDKFHTVRAGHRFKPGDKFSPRVWAGKPYRSKQITLGPDVEVKKTFDFFVRSIGSFDTHIVEINREVPKNKILPVLAENDGLDFVDFSNWFAESPEYKRQKQFSGQVICWNDKIEYP